MEQRSKTSVIEHYSSLEDPRRQAKVLYPLPEIVLLLLCATLADDLVETQLWGERNLGFLKRFLAYAHGVPSHDTLGEVIRVIDRPLQIGRRSVRRAAVVGMAPGVHCRPPDTVG